MRGNTCYVAATLNIYTPASHRAARFVGLPREEKTSPLFHLRCVSFHVSFSQKLFFKISKKRLVVTKKLEFIYTELYTFPSPLNLTH